MVIRSFFRACQPTFSRSFTVFRNRSQKLFSLVKDALYADEPTALGYPDASGMSNCYSDSVNITADEIHAVQQLMLPKISLCNTRLGKKSFGAEAFELRVASILSNPKSAVHGSFKLVEDGGEVHVTYGDHAAPLLGIYSSMKQAANYAANDCQREYLGKCALSYATGDIEKHKEASVAWVQDRNPTVEMWSGFLEPGRDPAGIRCEFEALVAIQNKNQTEAFDKLTDHAKYFVMQLPWTGEAGGFSASETGSFENEEFIRPQFLSLDRKSRHIFAKEDNIKLASYLLLRK